MNRGVLGTGPDANKRKRPDAQAAYISSMMHGNPKLLLSESPLFEGLTQHQLPFVVFPIKASPDVQYQARIRLAFPDGRESFGIGVARTKKESERVAAIDACQQLQDRGLLVGVKKSSAASVGRGDNPKNTLVNSVAFRDVCCGGNARALPITLRSSGPDHAKTFVAELTVPLRNKGEVFIAVGQGPNKAEAERACCTAACEKLHDVGLLQKPNDKGATPPSTTLPSPAKPMLIHQQNEQPLIVSLRNEQLSMMEDALQRLHLDNVRLETGEPQASVDLQPRSFSHKSNDISIPREQLGTENAIMRLEARKRSLSPEFAEQRRARQSLPAWRERQNVIDAVSNHRVVVLTGETGCGKTTQVPQYMLEEAELQGSGAEVHIVVTQPRRIAAISVAERVAWERGESLGRSVGYAIRLESSPPRARGSILYCTTGILLHRLQRTDGLAGVSHVIIDEVHERDVDTDFLLVVIRELLNHSPSLRVVVMSATLDASVFTRYFGGCPLVNIPGMTHPVKVYNLDDLPQLMGRFFLPASRPAHGGNLDEDVDVDLIVSVIVWVSQIFAQGDGAILCFLPGWDTISIVKDRLLKVRSSRFMIIVPLHSQLPAGEQRAAFSRAPSGMRKVVLATNIAETSVTIDDVVYVVDSGKIKEKQYDVSSNLTTMRVQWTSQASARQRQGRAGRVQAGFCFQLYSKRTLLSMLDHQIPEMQRVPLEELCLQIKAILSPSTMVAGKAKAAEVDTPEERCEATKVGTSGIATFLSKAIQPPTAFSVHAAIQVLQQLGAIDQFENLTSLGRTLARLTVHPRFGKMLVYGALLGCLDPLLTIAAAACFRDPFVSPLNKREEADHVRASFGTGVCYGSDQLALVNAFEQWKSADSSHRGHTFCEDNFLVFMTMRLIAGMRTQFERTLLEAGLCEPHVHSPTNPIVSAHLARSLLAAGLYPNIVRSELFRESKGMKTATKHAYRWRLGFRGQSGRVFLHPTSVLSEKNLNSSLNYYLVFQEKVQTSQVFVRGCTLLPHLAMVLLGWNVTVSKDTCTGTTATPSGDWMLLRVEGWMSFLIDHRAGLLLLQLRHAFDVVIARWISGQARTESERQVVECVITLLEGSCQDMLVQSTARNSTDFSVN